MRIPRKVDTARRFSISGRDRESIAAEERWNLSREGQKKVALIPC
jgi:hypothetical protein